MARLHQPLFLLVFNLVPALPLDGGRVLRATLWRIKGDFVWATRIAAAAGQAIAGGMIALGILLVLFTTAASGLWLAFLGWFLLSAARAEGRFARVQEALRGRHVADLMVRAPLTVEPDDTVEKLMIKVATNGRQRVFPVVLGDRVLGIVPLTWAAGVPHDEWVWRQIGEGLVPPRRARAPAGRRAPRHDAGPRRASAAHRHRPGGRPACRASLPGGRRARPSSPGLGGFGGMSLLVGLRWSFRDKDAGSVRSRSYGRD